MALLARKGTCLQRTQHVNKLEREKKQDEGSRQRGQGNEKTAIGFS